MKLSNIFESFIIYALLTIAKSYNNPIKLLQSYPSDKLFEKLVVDEYLDSFFIWY